MHPQISPQLPYTGVWKWLRKAPDHYANWVPEAARDAIGVMAGLAATAAAVDLVLMLLTLRP